MSAPASRRDSLTQRALRVPAVASAWGAARERQLLAGYRARRERYQRLCRARGLVYSPESTTALVRQRLERRGYVPRRRTPGTVSTFAFVPRIGWHEALLPHLRTLGPVAEFDYVTRGFSWNDFQSRSPAGIAGRREMNEQFFAEVVRAHRKAPLDWIFIYASGLEVSRTILERIERELGVPTVGMCLDDKQSWEGEWIDDQRAGQIDIAPALDLAWTSASVACGWYLAEGGRPLYQPSGCDPDVFRPLDVPQDVPVSFIGARYGPRAEIVRFLEKHGVPVRAVGQGWPAGPSRQDEALELLSRSVINLGIGGIGYSEQLTNVKGRDFEVPATGRGVYLTSFNPDLARHFDVGREIVCYRNRDELLELIRYYLERPQESAAIARAGRERCVAEHQWRHRYVRVLEVLGVLAGDTAPREVDAASA